MWRKLLNPKIYKLKASLDACFWELAQPIIRRWALD